MKTELFLECDLKTLRTKWVVTNSQALSAKLLQTKTHFGAEAHSVKSLASRLADLGLKSSEPNSKGQGSQKSAQISAKISAKVTKEDLELFGESLRAKLKPKNYFKLAFDLPGLREKVFNCLDELRLAGYEPSSLPKNSIDNAEKLESLREIFVFYNEYLNSTGAADYSVQLTELIDALHAKKFDAFLKNVDLIIPFTLDLKGKETSFLEVLEERVTTYKTKSAAESYRVATVGAAQSLEQFKDGLSAFIDRKPIVGHTQAATPGAVLDESLVVKASLRRDEALADVFDWMLKHQATVSTTAIVSPDYDGYAFELYRFCEKNQLALNLSRGLLACHFRFFAEDMAQIERLNAEAVDAETSIDFIKLAQQYFRSRKCDQVGYDSFKGQALSFVQSYLKASETFSQVTLATEHGFGRLRECLLQIRLSPSDLELDKKGLFFGRPEDLIGCETEHLVILGLQDHNYPPKIVPDAILTDLEREAINETLELGKYTHKLSLTEPKESQKDLLEKISLGVTKALYLGFESHDLESGALSLPSSFFNRVIATFGYPQEAKSIYLLGGLPTEFISDSQSIFLKADKQLASAGMTAETFSKFEQTLKQRRSREVNDEDGVSVKGCADKILAKDISASAVAEFFTCPYRFYLSRVLKITELDKLTKSNLSWLNALQRGEFIHAVFEGLTLKFLESPPSFKRWKEFLSDEASKLVEPLIAKVSLEYEESRKGISSVIVESELAEIRELVLEFIQREMQLTETTGFYPIKVEAEFKALSYKGLEVKFHGIVDRLDQNDAGFFRVIDYKTGKNRFNSAENLFVDGDDYVHFQHAVYGVWAVTQSDFAIKEDKLRTGYYFCSDKGEWAVVDDLFSHHLERFEQGMKLMQEALKLGEFAKNPSACTYCNYKLICGQVQSARSLFADPHPQLQQLGLALNASVDLNESGVSND